MNENIDIAVKQWRKRVSKRNWVTPKYLARTLRNDFKKIGLIVDFPIEHLIEIDDYVYDNDDFTIGGFFAPDIPTTDFTLRLLFPLEALNNGFELTDSFLDAFTHEVTQVAMHENRHKEQDEARDGKYSWPGYRHAKNRKEEYLGDYNEVDAFGIAIAYQLKQKLGTIAALDLLRHPSDISKEHGLDIFEYVKVFDMDHEVAKRLFKKIATHLLNDKSIKTHVHI